MTLAHVASQAIAKQRPPDAAAHKWNVYRDLCAARSRLGLTERSLALLNGLLSFHPETVLTGNNLVVFPSNEQLSLRAHGMPPSTMRRHLAVLVDAGVIIRRDSPNGKRYARKGRGGAIDHAFGFDLAPMIARAAEFATLAEEVRAEDQALRFARERITLARRDIVKIIATGLEEAVPVPAAGQGPTSWEGFHALYRSIVGRIPRTPVLADVSPIAGELAALADNLLSLLQAHIKNKELSANDAQNERHKQNSKTDPQNDLEPAFQESRAAEPVAPILEAKRTAETALPLGNGSSSLPRYQRLRPGWDLALARFDRRRQRRKGGAGGQPQRLGGGASGHGREFRLHRRRRDPAARIRDRQRRRVLARTHAQSGSQRILDRAHAHGPHWRPKSRQETRMRAGEPRQGTDYARAVACADRKDRGFPEPPAYGARPWR